MAALKGSRYCFTHDPATRAEQASARKKGGKNRYTAHAGDVSKIPVRIRSIKDVQAFLDYVRDELVFMDNCVARDRTLLALSEAYVKSFEIGELEKRIAALEARAGVK